jgi:hypothetical protein
MRTGYHWLLAGITGLALMAPSAALAQAEVPTAPVPGGPGSTGPQGSYRPPAPIRSGAPISVLVFPYGFAADEMMMAAPDPSAPAPDPNAVAKMTRRQEELSSYLTANLKAGLLSSPFFHVASYHPQSALVQRARKDDILRPEQITDVINPVTGAVDLEKAKVIANRLSMQAILVGSIELKTDPMKNSAEIVLETRLIDSTTGQPLRATAVSGAAAGADGVGMDAIEERAALEAVQKTLPELGIQLVPLPSAQPPPAKPAKMTEAEKKAAREAQKKAAAEKKAAEKARRDAEKAKKDGNSAAPAPKPVLAANPAPKEPVAAVQRDQAAETAAGAAPPPAAPAGKTVPGYTNASGQPVPYGYAIGEAKALPSRNRGGLRVPAWLGVAGFLAGLSFLL